MNWISVKDELPIKGQRVSIYGTLHAYREEYPIGTFKKSIEHDVIYYGKKEDNKIWFGGWTTENDGVTHWLIIPEPPTTKQL